MNRIEMVLPIKPIAWQRVKRGKYGQAYVPEKTALFKREIVLLAHPYKPLEPLSSALIVEMVLTVQRPTTVKRKWRTGRTDVDNEMKAIFDAFNGVFWKDDSQIVCVMAYKGYGYTSQIRISIEELPEDEV